MRVRLPQSLALRVVVSGSALLLLALTAIVLTLWVTWQLEGGAAAVNEAGRLRMMSYRMAHDAALGKHAALPAQMRRLEQTLDLLEAGDPSRPLFVPWNSESRSAFAAVRTQWLVMRGVWRAGTTPVASADLETLVQGVDRLVFLIERRLSRWTDVLRGFLLAMAGLAVACAVSLLYAMHLMVLAPLRGLSQGMDALHRGEFQTRVQVASGDEFGELAAGFNSMAARLQSLYGDLEARVLEKTERLEAKRQRLAALYEVAAFVAQAETADEMAIGFARRVRRIARADGVAVRWTGGSEGPLQTLAHDGATCSNHLGGNNTRQTVLARLHHRVLGEIDLFYRQAGPLDDEDRSLLEALASHLAGGVEGLRAAAADREAAVAAERAVLAQELHDSIAQSLAFLKIQVDLLRTALRREDAAATQRVVAEIDEGVRESYAHVRELLLHFRTRTSDRDIESALRLTLQKFERQTALPAQLRFEGRAGELPGDVQVQVLHVLQEALSNVRKHAGASAVQVNVQRAPTWRFQVDDNGCGFDSDCCAGHDHVGLRIMQERARRFGGEVKVSSRVGHGTRVEIVLPAQPQIQQVAA